MEKRKLGRSAIGALLGLAMCAAAVLFAACPQNTGDDKSGGQENPQQTAQEKADAFKSTHAAILAKTVETVVIGDEAAVTAALQAYAALESDVRALLGTEKDLLDNLQAKITQLKAAQNASQQDLDAAAAFRVTHGDILAETVSTVTMNDEEAVDAALEAYGQANATVQGLLADAKLKLDNLKSKIEEITAATRGTITIGWNDLDSAIIESGESGTIYRGGDPDTLTVTASGSFDVTGWAIDGVLVPGATSASFTVDADDYLPGKYRLSVQVEKDGRPYAAEIVFTVEQAALAAVQITPKDNTVAMLHNGGLHPQSDLNLIKAKIAANVEPWISGWNALTATKHAKLNFNDGADWYNDREKGATVVIVRGTGAEISYKGGTYTENYQYARWAVAGAYQKAVRWKLTDDPAYAEAAIGILNHWADVCELVSGTSDWALAAGIYGYQFAVAGELLRDYEGWDPTDFADFQQWLVDVFYYGNRAGSPFTNNGNDTFLTGHNNCRDDHYWANWDLANLAATLAIGVVADRRDIYNRGINYLLSGNGNGRWDKAINYIHDLGGGLEIAQNQESGRDQGHCTLNIGLLGMICSIAWTQGDDFFGYDDNRFLKCCEYVAKYNIALEDVPFHEYTRVYGNLNSGAQTEVHTVVSADGRGTVRPIWYLPYYHYKVIKGLPDSKLTYTKMGVENSGSWTVESGPDNGAAGDYDIPGFGTLLYTKEIF
ncbi:MAG: alginate lyase family protein [Treponema sp.]|jgi:hypothetical protein|nr:alginate lyase family protein [Treponema sp.]